MTLISDRIIESEDVRLDDHSFVDCTLNNCHLFYAGGYYALHNTHINNPTFSFDGAAQRTIDFLVHFNLQLSGMQLPPPPQETVN
jgi:hypothetical protein